MRPIRAVGELLAEPAVRGVVVLAFVTLTAIGLSLPVLALYARSFGASYAASGLLVSAYALARLGADLVAGTLAERLGERRAIAGGLAVFGAAALSTALVPSYPVAVLCWATGGLGSAIVFAAFYNVLLRHVPQERMGRTLGVFYASFNVGLVLGGLGAGAIAHAFGLASPIVATGVLALAGALLATRVLARVPRLPSTASLAPRPGRLLATVSAPGMPAALAANLAYLFMLAAVFDTLLPLRAKEGLGISELGVGLIFALALGAELAALWPAGSLVDRVGRVRVLVPAFLVLGAATVGLAWAPTPLGYALVAVALGVGSGAAGILPAAMLADASRGGRRGEAVSAFRFAGDLGFLLGPLVAGAAAGGLGFRGAFAIVAAPTLAALAIALGSRHALARAREPSVGP